MTGSSATVTPYIRGLADTIRAGIGSYGGVTLPPLRVLCSRLHASHPSVTKALRYLESEGLLSLHRGARTRLVSDARPERLPAAPDAVERARAALKDDILDRVYRAGDTMPKIHFLARTYATSKTTISGALRCLQKEGLVHRIGRSWVTGTMVQGQGGRARMSGACLRLCRPARLHGRDS